MDEAPFPLLWVGEAGGIGYANRRAEETFAKGGQPLVARTIADLDPEFESEAWREQIWGPVMARDRLENLKRRWRSSTGEWLPVQLDAVAMRVSGHEFVALYARLNPEESPAPRLSSEAGALDTSILEQLPMGVALLSGDGSIGFVNRAFCRLAGLSRSFILTRTLPEVLPPAEEDAGFWSSLGKEPVCQREFTSRPPSGRRTHLAVTILAYPGHERVADLVLLEDVDDRHRLKETLRANEVSFDQLAANVPGMLYRFVLTPDGRTYFPYVSAGCRDIWGVDPESVKQDSGPIVNLIHPDDVPGFQQSVLHSAGTLGRWEYEGRLTTPQGESRWWHAASTPELQADGSIVWQGLLMDVTRQKAIEQELQVAKEKAESAARA
ncbi:MAG: PAS domain S-box protein, partial [Verrucomicrobiae bacterium]|nr:PAS domain S-box protein [Verrucomicrobiae bacterium]